MKAAIDYSPTDLLNEHDAAKFLALSVTTLRTWRSTRRTPLKYYKLNRVVRYRVSDLEEFLQANVREG